MGGKVRRGLWRHMLPLPGALLGIGVEKGRKKIIEELVFMTKEHRAVHHFIVRQLPSHGIPMVPDFVAEAVDLPVERVTAILQELEEHMTFLFRNGEGAVVWAYPVTVEQTPHPMTFSSGEKIYAA